MNLRKFLFVLSVSITIFHLSAFSQRDSIPLTTIIAKVTKLNYDRPTEKVYLHFDKPYYAVGDTMWFKAYVTIDLHQPSPLSKIVYVDLTDPNNNLVAEVKMQVVNGVANSYMPLSGTYIQRGNYHIRAYTRWMRNADQAYFFNKTIAVGSTDEGQVIPHIFFKNTINDNFAKVTAAVIYKDQDGSPYATKKVSWKVVNDDETISRGHGETDANGILNISFTTDKTRELSSSKLNTELSINDQKPIINEFPIETTPPGIDVQFFPEGGNLINGIRSRVAFKAVKPDGLAIEVKGTVVDNAGTTIADFTSQHLGMGVFAMMPEANKTYKANVVFPDGTKASYDLPSVRSEGINLSVNNNNPDSLYIKIAANDPFFQKNKGKTFYVIAQSGGVVCYAAQAVLTGSIYGAAIPKSKFPTGIVQVTVFSAKGTPLSERIAFIQHNDQLSLTLRSDQTAYTRRQKVKLLVSSKSDKLPALGNFSVAVIDETKVPTNEASETTILSHLLLTSDLKGYVQEPNYYFIKPDTKTNTDLDVLMLTQGYRRFSYKNVIADKSAPMPFLPEEGIEISGTLRTNAGLPVAKGNVRLSIPDKGTSIQAVTDMSGNFKFTNIAVADTSKIMLNARDNANGNDLTIAVDPIAGPPSTQYITSISEITNIDSTLKPYLQNAKRQLNATHALKEVVIRSTVVVKKPSHEDYPTLRLLTQEPDHLIPGDRFTGCANFVTCLSASALGITYDENNFYLTKVYSSGNKTTPVQIYINGLQADFFSLTNIDPVQVESVEIFNTDGLSGINRTTSTKGIMVINLKKAPKGEKISKDQLMDMLHKNYELEFIPGGYAVAKEFYVPKYDGPAGGNVPLDLRSTIYWNPRVLTDKDGNASVEFFNADGTGTYRAVIEGIDKDGNIGRYVYHYKVQ